MSTEPSLIPLVFCFIGCVCGADAGGVCADRAPAGNVVFQDGVGRTLLCHDATAGICCSYLGPRDSILGPRQPISRQASSIF